MPAPRDPRREPAAGDQLRSRFSGAGTCFRVLAVTKQRNGTTHVEYEIPPMRSVHVMTLEAWRELMSGAMEVYGRSG